MELITVQTSDGISLDGAWYPCPASRTGVLLIHGRAQNFYTSVVRWLAPYFAQRGYASLALNMRDHDHADREDGIPGAPLDLQAGLDFLKSQEVQRWLLVGVSYGSNKAALYLAHLAHPEDLLGVLLMSAGGIQTYLPDLWSSVLAPLHTLSAPLLVIQAGSDEFVPGPEAAGRQIVQAASASSNARLAVIPGANHGFSQHQEEVYREIAAWLNA